MRTNESTPVSRRRFCRALGLPAGPAGAYHNRRIKIVLGKPVQAKKGGR